MNDQQTQSAQREARSAPRHGSARSVQRISKFLRVVSDDSMPDERGVMSNDNKLIAVIGHYKPWREWVLYPEPKTVWSADCLVAIKSHLAWMSKVVQVPNLAGEGTALVPLNNCLFNPSL